MAAVDISAETLQARSKWQDIFKVLKEKKLQPLNDTIDQLDLINIYRTFYPKTLNMMDIFEFYNL